MSIWRRFITTVYLKILNEFCNRNFIQSMCPIFSSRSIYFFNEQLISWEIKIYTRTLKTIRFVQSVAQIAQILCNLHPQILCKRTLFGKNLRFLKQTKIRSIFFPSKNFGIWSDLIYKNFHNHSHVRTILNTVF